MSDPPQLPGLTENGILAIGHRGASVAAPENTFAALDEALRQGCGTLEVDLQLTRDRVPVLFHDRDLGRFGRPDRQVAHLALGEVKELQAGPAFGFRKSFRDAFIPTLEETLDRYGHRARLFLEIKLREGEAGWDRHVDLLRLTLAQVDRADLSGRVAVLSFNAALMDICAQEAPHLPRVLNVRPFLMPGGDLLRRLPRLSALSARVRTLTAGFGRAVTQEGCPLLAFVCNTQGTLRRSLAAGARGIMSDRPDWLISSLESERRAG